MITVDFQCLHVQDGSRILDIGCGSGRHTAAAFDLKKGSVIGADPNFKDLQEACARLDLHARWTPSNNCAWSLAAADISNLPFRDSSFDVVICSEVLEHITDHRRAIQECIRVLKPGSQLVVSIPRRWPETICWALSRQYRHTPGGHLRIFNAQNLVRLIQSGGVILWRTHYAHSLHTPYWWLKCLLGIERDALLPVKAYQRFLTWDIMQKPRLTRRIEQWLNPAMGKSTVLYFRKQTQTAQ
jgi:2-polyprenyl-3-methyl-5-hydroxy-6-metoxy-1,4-benzoquinol methylase